MINLTLYVYVQYFFIYILYFLYINNIYVHIKCAIDRGTVKEITAMNLWSVPIYFVNKHIPNYTMDIFK